MYHEFQARTAQLKIDEKATAVESFNSLLAEYRDRLNENTTWREFKAKVNGDQRYTGLKSSSLREKLFEEYIMANILVTPG